MSEVEVGVEVVRLYKNRSKSWLFGHIMKMSSMYRTSRSGCCYCVLRKFLSITDM